MSDDTFYEGGEIAEGTAVASPKPVSPGKASQPLPDTESKEDEVITSAKLNKILADLEVKFQKNQDRVVSLIDKRVAAAKKESDIAIEKLKKSGIKLTPEDETRISRSMIEDAMLDTAQPEPTQASGNQDAGNVIAQFVNSEAARILEELGVDITPAEAKTLIPEANQLSPYQFLRRFHEVAEAKKNNQQNAPTRIPTLATTGGTPGSEEVLKQQYQNEIAQIMAGTHPSIKRGQNEKITAMKAEYAKKGLRGIY